MISIVRLAVHLLTGVGESCRFVPCCSAYAKEVWATQKSKAALVLIFKRLGRCHPFSSGGYDPVPTVGGIHGV